MRNALLLVFLVFLGRLGYSQNFHYLFDYDHTVTIDSVKKNAVHFIESDEHDFNFGFIKAQVWLKHSVENPTANDSIVVISIAYPLLNEIEYFELHNDSIIRNLTTGDLYPYSSRDIKSRHYAFKVMLPANSSKSIYFRIKNDGETVRIPINTESLETFYIRTVNEKFALSPYYGFIIFAIIFNLLLFLSLRDRVYFYFSMYILSLGSFLANIDGLYIELLWQNSPFWADHSTITFIGFTGVFFLAFTREFLKMTNLFPIINKLFFVLIGLCFLTILGSFSTKPFYTFVVKFANIYTLVYVVFAISIGIIAWSKKYKPAQSFSISFLILMLGVTVYVLRNAAILPHNDFTSNGVKLGVSIQILILSFAVSERFRKIMSDTQNKLEQEVKLRTAELEAQRDYLHIQNKKIEKQHIEITDSIKYAERIQRAALPSNEYNQIALGEHFIIYIPCNIVSGDFYWVSQHKDETLIAVADCTGHGVPGGFLSMLGISFLNEIDSTKQNALPNQILNELRSNFIKTLTASSGEIDTKDGMDIAICKINFKKRTLNYAGAHIPLFIVRNGTLITHKADPMPVGKYIKDSETFTNTVFTLEPNDMLYLFTDGFSDQVGEMSNKKLKKKAFKELLIENATKDIKTQEANISTIFEQWKGNKPQIDDVLLIGIRIS